MTILGIEFYLQNWNKKSPQNPIYKGFGDFKY